MRERIFERFVRLGEARVRDAGGAGLGLSVVRAMVHHLNGEIAVVGSPLGDAHFDARCDAHFGVVWPAAEG